MGGNNVGYDEGKMFSTVEDYDDGPEDVGYLNRRTGEILFLCPPNDEAWTDVPADELMESQARVLKEPHDWLEIPKICNHPALRDIPHDQKVKDLIKEFFDENGITPAVIQAWGQ